MHSKTLKRYLAYSLLVASFGLPAASAKQQERQERKAQPNFELPIVKGECPRPITLTLTAKNPTSFVTADFSPVQSAAPHMTGLGDTSINKNFLYTFQWKRDQRCCQITRAILTVNMKSNQSGKSGSSDASNDGIAIMHYGNVVAPYNEAVYSSVTKPFGLGQPASKSWNLNPAALNNINVSGNLSFAVQDDTRVESATLQLWGCCLDDVKGPSTEESPTPNSRN
jgi:hypothetical protein